MRTDSIREVWLFGSRAKCTARPDSDIDLAIYLMPPSGKHDWAYGAYQALGDAWQSELGSILGQHASLEHVSPDIDPDSDHMVRTTGIQLWVRT